MSRAEYVEDLARLRGAGEPPDAGAEQDEHERDSEQAPAGGPRSWAGRRGLLRGEFGGAEAVQALSLLALTVSLALGLWKSHPALAVGLLVVALAPWAGSFRRREPRRWWFVYVGGLYMYTLLRAGADDHGLPIQMDYVIKVDEFLFDGVAPSVTLQRTLFSPFRVDWVATAATLVHWSFFVVPHAVAVLIWWRSGHAFSRYVLTVTGVLYAGLLIFFLLPTAPPWLAARAGELPWIYRVIDIVGRGVEPGTYGQLRETLGEPNSVAALPSIHMALTFTLVLWARRGAPRLVPLAMVYSLAMAISLIYLGEHYFVDVAAGAMLAALVDVVVHRRRGEVVETVVSGAGEGGAPG